jgi:hypothetical protein
MPVLPSLSIFADGPGFGGNEKQESSYKRQLMPFQDGQLLRNEMLANIEDLTILVKCGAAQLHGNPLAVFLLLQ